MFILYFGGQVYTCSFVEVPQDDIETLFLNSWSYIYKKKRRKLIDKFILFLE